MELACEYSALSAELRAPHPQDTTRERLNVAIRRLTEIQPQKPTLVNAVCALELLRPPNGHRYKKGIACAMSD